MENLTVVWAKDWIHPFESPWSILEKYALANVTSRGEVLSLLGCSEIKSMKHRVFGDKHRDLISFSGFDQSLLFKFLGVDIKELSDRNIHAITHKLVCECRPANTWFYPNLRWCSKCMNVGFHSILHQFILMNHCPFHMIPLFDQCPNCQQQLSYKFTDRATHIPFQCSCGRPLYEEMDGWNSWGKPLQLQCPYTLRWLSQPKENGYFYISNLRHVSSASNPLKLLSTAYENQHSVDLISICSEKKSFLGGRDQFQISMTPHQSYYEFQNHKYYEMFMHLYEITRSAYLLVDRHLRSKVLRKHTTCIQRLQYLLKEPGHDFPKICPLAYAYVFWRQSLLGIDAFYRIQRAVPHAKYTEVFKAIGDPFLDSLQFLFDQYIMHSDFVNHRSTKVIERIIYRSSVQYYYQYFRNWSDVAKQCAIQVTMLSGEQLRELAIKNMPFFVFKIPLENNNNYGTYLEIGGGHKIDDLEMDCPFRSQRKRKIKKDEISFSPLSMSLSNIDEAEIVMATQYLNKLRFK